MDRLSWSLTALKLDKKYFNDAKQIIKDLGLSIMMAKESKINENIDVYMLVILVCLKIKKYRRWKINGTNW